MDKETRNNLDVNYKKIDCKMKYMDRWLKQQPLKRNLNQT